MKHNNEALSSENVLARGARAQVRYVFLLALSAMTWCAMSPAASAQNVQHTKNAPGIGMRSVFKVNPATNALELQVPLGPTGYPQRGGAGVAPAVNYSSRIWRIAYAAPIYGYNPQGPPPVVGTRVVPMMAEDSRMGWTYSLAAPRVEKTAQEAAGGEVYDASGNSLSMCRFGGENGAACCFIDRVRIHMPGGGTQEFRSSDRPICYTESGLSSPLPDDLYSVDGSRMRYNRSQNKLYLPDGSYWELASGTTPAQYFDRNGNRLLNGLTDGLGRAFADPLDPTLGTDYTYAVPGVGGAPLNYTFRWRYLNQVLTVPLQPGQELPNLSDMCGNTVCAEPYLFRSDTGADQPIRTEGGAEKRNPLVLHQIELPTGQAYTFTYNVYAEIDKVVYPTGGYERFEYGPVEHQQSGTFVYAQGNRGVTDRWVSARGDGTDEVRWRYHWFDSQGQPQRGEITPDGTRTERVTYYTSFGITFWSFTDIRAGRPREERVYNAAGQMIRRRLSEWANTGSDNCPPGGGAYSACTATRNPRLTKEVEIIIEPGGQALAKITTYGYDLTHQFTTGVSQTSVSEYDFVSIDLGTAQTGAIESFTTTAQPPRRTQTAYLDAANGAYRDRHILGLPTSVEVRDGAGTLMAESTVAYDESLYQLVNNYGPVANWTDPGALRGNATTAGRWLNTTGGYVETHAKYDQVGNVVASWDANGNQTQTEYSPAFSYAYQTSVTTAAPNPEAVPDPADGPDFAAGTFGSTAGFTSYTDYDLYTGLVTATTDVNRRRTAFNYADPLNRLKRVDLPDGGRTTHTYVDAHQCGPYVETRTLLDASGREMASWQFFDGLGRPYSAETQETQDPANPYLRVDTRYDSMGRVSQVSNPYRTSGCTAQANPSGQWTTTEYDALGRVTKVTTPDGAKVYTLYDGARTLVTDQAKRQRISRTDALGRLAEVWEVRSPDAATGTESVSFPVPGELAPDIPAVSAGYRTGYTYDALGNLRKVEQGGQLRFFMYDSLSRLTRARNPEQAVNASLAAADPVTGNGQWTFAYGYDANGNLTSRADARGVQTAYTYDRLSRNILAHYAGGGTSTPGVRRYYDNPLPEANGKGRLWKSESLETALTTVDKYDEVGRPKEQTQKFSVGADWGPQAYTTKLTYNLAGGVTSQEYPSTHKVEYQYDVMGRLGDNDQLPAFKGNLGDGAERTYASQVTYSEFGGLREERFGTETPLYHKRHYNRRGQLFDIRLSTVALATSQWDWNRGAIVNYYGGNYAWEGDPETPASADNNGNLRRQRHFVPSHDQISTHTFTQQTYEYDALNRLSSVVEAAGANGTAGPDSVRQAYDYDRWGNRTIDAAGTWLGQPTAPPSELVNEKQFDKADLANTNRLYAPGDTGRPMNERLMRYDAAGNLTHDAYTGAGGRSYDAEGRMTSAADNYGGTTHYAYDADGRRVRRKVGAAAEVWQVYGAGGELLAEYAEDALPTQPRKEYGYRGGELLVTAEVNAAVWGPPPAFTGPDPLKKGDPIKLENLTELRAAVNQLRQRAELPPYNFTVDPNPVAKVTKVRADHIRQLRQALEGARTQLGLSTGGYGQPTLTEKVSPVYAVDFQELREQIRGAWQGGSTGVDLRWLVSDQLGTPRMVVDKTGGLSGVTRHDYLPFGEELSAGAGGRTDTQGYSAADNVRQQFTGYERDTETSLDYAQARYYANPQGRFISVDPLYFQFMMTIDPQRFNLYAYARNNPLKFVDPAGENLHLRGNTDWLTTNVLYEMAGGQETFDQYFEIVNGQVILREGVDTSEASEGVKELSYMVLDSYNYVYFAGEGEGGAEQAASLFKGALNRDGTFTYQGGNYVNKFADGGYLVGTQGREGQAQPANLPNGDPVFAVIAYNTKAVFTQAGVDDSALHYADRNTQESGLNQPIRPMNIFLHEGAENRSFARMTTAYRSTEQGYRAAHGYAQVREKKIRQELKIMGGFAGGAPLTKVINN